MRVKDHENSVFTPRFFSLFLAQFSKEFPGNGYVIVKDNRRQFSMVYTIRELGSDDKLLKTLK